MSTIGAFVQKATETVGGRFRALVPIEATVAMLKATNERKS